ncbi:hypothetical protein SKP52_10895 [Sphingopyxis fribergensis]|uniref:DUF5681 domain-containing protein n=1 Tax=Sphingopyxis fribergensis TaxID=1515612 RepID=A0A0A7PGF5_9SPHN|nr:hypothetical protein [Sphingopyxis fribergensis]AJA09080.1 hypothetical protein SKP52_10895 [Sphingopyxis fribergensis]
MNAITPPWGSNWTPAPPEEKPARGAGNPAWVAGGPSPNPSGRPPGLPDKRLLATQSMLDEMRGIVAVLIGKALEGDTNAASIVLAKTLPSIKAQAEKVQFAFDATAPVSDQVAQVLDAIAAGAVAPDVGRLIIDSIKSLSDIRATEELSARIEALEEARDARR